VLRQVRIAEKTVKPLFPWQWTNAILKKTWTGLFLFWKNFLRIMG